jgi:hypothetical protein
VQEAATARELKSVQEAEVCRQEAAAAREAALERQKKEKLRKQLEEQVFQLVLLI